MRTKISLDKFLLVSFISLGLAIMAAYSLVSTSYLVRGLDLAMAVRMEKVASNFSRNGKINSLQIEDEGFTVTSDWREMPSYVHESFSHPPTDTSTIHKDLVVGGLPHNSAYLVFLMRYESENSHLYVSYKLLPLAKTNVIKVAEKTNTKFKFSVSLLIIFGIVGISIILLRYVSRPILALKEWTNSLDTEKISNPIPDFRYSELNDMAKLVRDSLVSVKDSTEREKKFLRHASHELRTPISTLLSNVELLKKLNAMPDEPERQIFQRIDRASQSMKYITETLLWLNHQPSIQINVSEIDVGEMITELVEEMTYLLKGKPTIYRLKISQYRHSIPAIQGRIVLGNLIRNAFQHCWKGEIIITQTAGSIVIENPIIDRYNPESHHDGFGLGLELVKQLSNQMGWEFSVTVTKGVHVARIVIN